jgi:FAD synthase
MFDVVGEIIHGKGVEKDLGMPTANLKMPKDSKFWDGDILLYVCDSKYGPAIIWRLKNGEDSDAMAYFINLSHNSDIYGDVELKNVNPVSYQRQTEFVHRIITDNYLTWKTEMEQGIIARRNDGR